MWSVILAAGLGSRLNRKQKDIPKPLTPVGKTTFLDRLYRQLRPVSDGIVVVGGHGFQHLQRWAEDKDVILVFNRDYLHTQNSLSAVLGLTHIPPGEDAILADGDLWIEDDVLNLLINVRGSAVLVSTGADEEAMKVEIKNGRVLRMSKALESDYETTGIQRLSSKLIKQVIKAYNPRIHSQLYYEEVISPLLGRYHMVAVEVPREKWIEVDTEEDLMQLIRRLDTI